MTARIVAISGPLTGRLFPLGDTPVTFGRSPENTIVIASQRASRRHAEIRREGGVYLLIDLGSSNGTILNGQLIQRQILRTGDTFVIGDEMFRFEEVAGATLDPTLPVGSAPAPAAPGWSAQPLPSPPDGGFRLPPGPPVPAQPQPQLRRLPIWLLIGGLFTCIILAGAVTGSVM
ncbi:MAG: FHA domain-containing protein, partial [Chloroflexus sp.]|nr:FHA domain-containing protein [Chloroflexus sp.]